MEPSDPNAPQPSLPAPDASLIPEIQEGSAAQHEGLAENSEADEHVQAAQDTEGEVLTNIQTYTWALVPLPENYYDVDPRLYDPANNVASTAQPPISSGIAASVPVGHIEPLAVGEYSLPAPAPQAPLPGSSYEGKYTVAQAPSAAPTPAHSTLIPATTPSPINTLKLCSKKCAAPPRPASAFSRSMKPYGPLVERSQCNECTRMYNRGNMSPAEFQRLYVNPDEALHAQWRAEHRRASIAAATEAAEGAVLEAPQHGGAVQTSSTHPVPEEAGSEQS
ncbi:uncharacterized protein DNG_04166 [Cephalotrichum gorgonifer]|uniref:Uncharacterized protein n=1 Tax=Cephalotrichum gorgonifer TaxID=2041049 RepID=A0AAE8MXL1_9PEZI|nr:uncharacterized protein DNG_04166 [Cephalotrichum gorgonifer]